jgi:uncharacterized protein YhaN
VRIDRIELRAFGPFTGAVLDFASGGRGLQVIFGRNETGKSSALRAIDAALFGIGGQTTDAFVHEYNALRIAMALKNAKGDQLAFVRRKANKGTLRDAQDDAPLPDDALRAFLGGVDRHEFARVFGLDHVRLRAGGNGLLAAASGSGGAAAELASAAIGIQDLRSVRRAIEQERDALFRPGASKPEINTAIARWKDLKSEASKRSLLLSAWQEKNLDVARLEAERDAADAAEQELRKRHEELRLVNRNRQRVARLAQVREGLSALVSVRELAEDFELRRRNAEDQRRDASSRAETLASESRQRHDRLAQLPAHFPLLERTAAIADLRRKAIEIAKALSDRERRQVRLERLRQDRDERARALGLTVPLAAPKLDELRIALESRERCDRLVTEHARIATAQQTAVMRRAELEREQSEIEARCAARGEPIDPAPLTAAIALAHGGLDERIAAAIREHAEITRAIVLDTAQMRGFDGDLDGLPLRRVPGSAEVAHFERRFDDLEREAERLRSRARERVAQRARLEADLARIAAGGTVPTERDLVEERARRDMKWRLVRRAWIDGADVSSEARLLDSDHLLPESFERSIAGADEIADRLRRESARVAQLEATQARIDELDCDNVVDTAAELDRVERERHLAAEWDGVWRESKLEARRPAEMKDALAIRARVVERLAARARTMDARAEFERHRSGAIEALRGALRACHVDPSAVVADDGSAALVGLLAAAEKRCADLEADLRAREHDEENLRRVSRECGNAEDSRAARERELAAWQRSFAAATRGLGLDPSDPPDAAPSRFDRTSALIQAVDQVAEAEGQIEKIDRDEAELRRAVAEFTIADAGSDGIPPHEFVERLSARVEHARREQQQYETELAELERVAKALREQQEAASRALHVLEDLAKEAGASSAEALPDLVLRAGEKRRLRVELEQLGVELAAEGLPPDELERRVRAHEGVDIALELGPLAAALASASADAKSKREAAAAAKKDLEALTMNGGSAEVTADMAGVAAGVTQLAGRFAQLTLASRLLAVAVERFRRRNETPLLRSASRYFELLTRARYAKIDVDIRDDGEPFFLTQEAGGAVKEVPALSDGTRDQLHLALILGSLELRSDGGAELLPLVLDDVLVHFDDDRSVAALEALAEFSKTTQVLLFTHHERIAEQARSLVSAHDVSVQSLV